MSTLTSSDLVPPDDLLFDGTSSGEDFINFGNGFMWNLLIARAGLKPSHAVLDIGSGNGQKARALTTYLNAEGRYVGFDIVQEGVAWCRSSYAKYPNFRFDHVDLKSDWYNATADASAASFQFPYAAEEFDVAFMASVATHLLTTELRNYLEQAFRVLKPGGCLLMTCFLINELNVGKHANEVQGRTFSSYEPGGFWVLDPDSPRRGVGYDEFALRGLCGRAGFVVAEITYGKWSNGIDKLGSLQDTVLLVKPA